MTIYAADYALVDGDTLARAALRDREIRLATRPSDCTCADEYGPVSPYCDPCLTFDDEVRAATERMDDREPALAREVIRLNEELAAFRAAVKDESKHLDRTGAFRPCFGIDMRGERHNFGFWGRTAGLRFTEIYLKATWEDFHRPEFMDTVNHYRCRLDDRSKMTLVVE